MSNSQHNARAEAFALYPNLAPRIEAALAADEHLSARAIFERAGSFYAMGSVRRVLTLLTEAGVAERRSVVWTSGTPHHLYRRARASGQAAA